MSDDPDLPKAVYALQVLRQARFSRNETAARMVQHLAYVTANTGLRAPEIEEAQQAAWLAISELASTLEKEAFAPPSLWKAALRAIESWIELLK
jgi:ADP-ribose pyrophosphatase YjhB (NUDIX family)